MAAQSAQEKADAAKAAADKQARESAEAGTQPADASATAAAAADPQVVVTPGASPKYSTKPGDVAADPRTGQPFGTIGGDGLKGAHGAELLDATGPIVPGVDPRAIPAEVTPGVSPDAGGDKLLAAAQAKAPSLTAEFVSKMQLSDEQLGQIARGEIPPPPTPGPVYTADMYMTPGGFQQTPPGVPPEDVGGNQVHRA